MYLTRHQDMQGPPWALDGYWLPQDFNLKLLLEIPGSALIGFLKAIPVAGSANDILFDIVCIMLWPRTFRNKNKSS